MNIFSVQKQCGSVLTSDNKYLLSLVSTLPHCFCIFLFIIFIVFLKIVCRCIVCQEANKFSCTSAILSRTVIRNSVRGLPEAWIPHNASWHNRRLFIISILWSYKRLYTFFILDTLYAVVLLKTSKRLWCVNLVECVYVCVCVWGGVVVVGCVCMRVYVWLVDGEYGWNQAEMKTSTSLVIMTELSTLTTDNTHLFTSVKIKSGPFPSQLVPIETAVSKHAYILRLIWLKTYASEWYFLRIGSETKCCNIFNHLKQMYVPYKCGTISTNPDKWPTLPILRTIQSPEFSQVYNSRQKLYLINSYLNNHLFRQYTDYVKYFNLQYQSDRST